MVVVIIGILIAIAIPLYLNYQKGANDKSAQSDVRDAVSTLEQCNSDNGNYPTGFGALQQQPTLTGCTGQSIKVSGGTTMPTPRPATERPPTWSSAPTRRQRQVLLLQLGHRRFGQAESAATTALITCP